MTFDDVRKIALALDHVEESTSYGTPAFKVRGKLVARLREDGETLVVGMDFDQRDPHTVPILVHSSRPLPRGTLGSIIRMAGVGKKRFFAAIR